ncbi:MAG: fliW [Acidimicrobiales bacterium]|nr:fliW [Acidimicrobiales bacterium]
MHEASHSTPNGSSPEMIHTPDGLPGFDSARHWSLDRAAPDAVFGLLNNLDQPGIGLMVTEPWELAPGYEPDLPDEELERIGIRDASDISVLVVATIGTRDSLGHDSSTGDEDDNHGVVWLNLAAPITVNVRTHTARQVILDRQGWPLRHPVMTRS